MRTLTLAGALMVVHDMRPEDRACVRALTGSEPDDWFAIERFQSTGVALELLQAGQPWAIAGVNMPNKWTGVFWLVARPGLTGESWRALIRQARKALAWVLDTTNSEYRHRIEAHVLAAWPAAQRFAARLGFVLEHVRKGAGSAGEDLQVWVRLGAAKGA